MSAKFDLEIKLNHNLLYNNSNYLSFTEDNILEITFFIDYVTVLIDTTWFLFTFHILPVFNFFNLI